MTSDRQDRIQEHIETLEAIRESLQKMLNDEVIEWEDKPESLKNKTMFFDYLEMKADLRCAILNIEFSICDLKHTEVEE